MTKRILFFCGGSTIFGKETVVLQVAEGARRQGHTIQFLANGWNDGSYQQKVKELEFSIDLVKLGWYYLRKPLWTLDSLFHYPLAIWQTLKIINRFKPDHIYVDDYRYIILLYPFVGRKFIYHVHDTNSQSKKNHFFLKLATKKIKLWVAVSEFIKADLINCGLSREKIKVVYNGVDIPIQTERKEYNHNKELRIGIVGQLVSRKGHHILFESIARIKEEIPISLCVYGTGNKEYIASLKKQAAKAGIDKQIKWMGFEPDKEKIYQSIDILAAPTTQGEPFGLVVAEANAYEIPVLASADGAFPEMIEEGVNGFLFPSGDTDALAKLIIRFYKDPLLRKKMGDAGRERVNRYFSISHMQEEMNEVFSETDNKELPGFIL